MVLTRRGMIGLVGGGVVLAATGGAAFAVTRTPQTALRPWAQAGTYDEPRMRALSYALLVPNPHNRQPWLADLGEAGVVTLLVDQDRLLPETDPFNRQITVGLGAFLEVMRMAAAEDGYRVDLTLFPEGEDPAGLDGRPVARAVFARDAGVPRDPLFAWVPHRRSNKEPFDTERPVEASLLGAIGAAVRTARFGASVDEADVAFMRDFTTQALRIEVGTPRTYQESVDLFRIGAREVDASPDGIDFSGPLFESLRLTGFFSREGAATPGTTFYEAGMGAVLANAESAMGHVWLVTAANARGDQIAAGADWVRLNLAATAEGVALHPLSQSLQEFPEMAGPFAAIHERLAPDGGTVQMLGRVGYGPAQAPSPRWPIETRVVNG